MKSIAAPAICLVIFLATWQVLHASFSWNSIIVPSPTEIAGAMVSHWDRLLREVSLTMGEALAGFVLGAACAYAAAVVFVLSPITRQALFPYAIALKSTPLIVIAPLLVMWFGNGLGSKVIMAALVAFFPVLVNALDGLVNVEREHIELMQSISATNWQTMLKLRIPNSMPYLFSGLRTASSLAVVGAIIGEFTGATRGVGHLINTSSYYLETAVVFAAIIWISAAGIGFFALVGAAEQWLLRWRPNGAMQ